MRAQQPTRALQEPERRTPVRRGPSRVVLRLRRAGGRRSIPAVHGPNACEKAEGAFQEPERRTPVRLGVSIPPGRIVPNGSSALRLRQRTGAAQDATARSAGSWPNARSAQVPSGVDTEPWALYLLPANSARSAPNLHFGAFCCQDESNWYGQHNSRRRPVGR